ncbi:MAG: hypothetical protein IRZ05_16605 [Micromonosporaceae bacterium]|jgi:hypothetical protein|nr:hypothetical protein [Micromonosporaceae bacterium]
MPDERHPGQTQHTREHDKIRSWAEARGGEPATVPGTEHGDRLGVLRIDFPGYKADNLRRVTWEEWFGTFDERSLEFVYQEEKKDGTQSNFFRLVSPEREEA